MNEIVKKVIEMKQDEPEKFDVESPIVNKIKSPPINNNSPNRQISPTSTSTTINNSSNNRRDSFRRFFKLDKSRPTTALPKYETKKVVALRYRNEIKNRGEDKIDEETESTITNWDEDNTDDKVNASADCVAVDVVEGKNTNQKTHQNTYVAKKTAAQGLMDIALLTANANQLRYLIEYSSLTTTYYINIFLISLSLILQMAVGISLIFKGRYYYRGQSKRTRAKRLNSFVLVGVFLITIINVFVASFTTITPLNQLNRTPDTNKV